ncbi:MAG: GNAT family N-acetyltransferase [Candidatus Altiarchaeota archaeon]|nr:GNAT family N-acetyltransferase [Candidatus Altiarchaeota archaeon]
MDSRPEIRIMLVKAWPAGEIIELYKAGGWWKDTEDESLAEKIISGSYAFAIAVEKGTGKAVGMGRALSDGASDAYIQDVVVLPEYRKKDIGKRIIAALRDHCLSEGINWIALVAQPGTEGFYSGLGFRRMEGYAPMKYAEDAAR